MLFEIYSQESVFTTKHWQGIVDRILYHTPYFEEVAIEVWIQENEILFYIDSKKDLSGYANELLPFIVTPVAGKLADYQTKFCHIDFGQRENVIHLKEREQIRKQRSLFRVRYTFHKIPFIPYAEMDLDFVDGQGVIFRSHRRFFSSRLALFSVNFTESIQYKKRKLPTYVKLQKVAPFLQPQMDDALLEVMGFPYFSQKRYIPISNFAYDKHTLIMGQTGTGKSKFIEFLLKDLDRHKVPDEYSLVILDPHAALYTNCSTIEGCANIDFIRTSCQLFAQIGNPNIATELTIMLFKTLMKDQFNAKMERVLKYVLFVLFSMNKMSLENLKLFLTDIGARKGLLMESGVAANILQFFDTDYVEMETKYYDLSISPILTVLDELTFLPVSNFQDSTSLETLLNENRVLFLSLHQVLLGAKATKLIAGLLIQQIFLLAQSGRLKRKILFFIDEVSVVQNESLAAILSEARKFGLFLFLSQQYLKQVDEYILKSIITNTYNYFLFRISEDDAQLLANGLEFDFPEDQLQIPHKESVGQREFFLKIKMMTELNPRECLGRVYANGAYLPVFKGRTLDVK